MGIDSYSGFYDNMRLYKTRLESLLREGGCSDVYVCGIATDICVASTASQANELGFRTVLIEDASRGIKEEDIQAALKKIQSNHGLVVQSDEVKSMVEGRDRRPELGYKL